jgi:hypothetical protein
VGRSILGSKDSRAGRGLDGRAPAGSNARVSAVMRPTSGRAGSGCKDRPYWPDGAIYAGVRRAIRSTGMRQSSRRSHQVRARYCAPGCAGQNLSPQAWWGG